MSGVDSVAKGGSGHPSDRTRLLSDALSLLRAQRFPDCLRLLDRAGLHGAVDVGTGGLRAYALAALGRIEEALPIARAALAAVPATPWALDLLGNAFTLCHRADEAYTAFKAAHEAAPDHPDLLLNLATAAGFLGRADEAERAYDRIIALAPDRGEPYLNRSALRRQTPEANHVAALRALLSRGAPTWALEVHLRYALGKELEDLGEHDAAFESFAAGAALRRRQMRYAVADDVSAMRLIAATHDVAWCASTAVPQPHCGPIFILGMPRSGSTLLERALGRHGAIQPLGELQTFGQALIATFRSGPAQPPTGKAELIRRSANLDPAALGNAYLSAVAPLRDARPHFIDKLPINFLYAGLIARALPTATLIHIRRDPLDLGVAIFKTLFRDAYPFSYDLAELGAYLSAYNDLMSHWRQALAGRLVEIAYEDLVDSPRDTIASLLAHLELAFDEDCLRPEEELGAVMTASAAQVRRPFHTRSVGVATRYRSHLGPLSAALAQ